MASILRVNTLTDASSNNSVPTETLSKGTVKAWTNFNGTGTIAARESFNVSSLNDDNTGRYTVSFSSNMEDANFVPHASANGRAAGNFTYDGGVSVAIGTASGSMVSSSIGMQVSDESGNSEDSNVVALSVVR
tara:strand:+ start:259 stop:657 length:399 start_codon:yes stop_codon:yes gene_type:complete